MPRPDHPVSANDMVGQMLAMGVDEEAVNLFASLHLQAWLVAAVEASGGEIEIAMPSIEEIIANRRSVATRSTDGDEARTVLFIMDTPPELRATDAVMQMVREEVSAGLDKPRPDTSMGRNQPCPCGSGKKYKRCCG